MFIVERHRLVYYYIIIIKSGHLILFFTDPYLDFTCVASQALMSPSTSQTLIEVYTPLRNATIKIDGKPGDSTQTYKVGPVVCRLETDDLEATTTVIISSEDGRNINRLLIDY